MKSTYNNNQKGLDANKLLDIFKQIKPIEYLGFTVTPAMYQKLKSQTPNKDKMTEFNLANFGMNHINGTEVYQVNTQNQPILKWNNREAMMTYIEVSESQFAPTPETEE